MITAQSCHSPLYTLQQKQKVNTPRPTTTTPLGQPKRKNNKKWQTLCLIQQHHRVLQPMSFPRNHHLVVVVVKQIVHQLVHQHQDVKKEEFHIFPGIITIFIISTIIPLFSALAHGWTYWYEPVISAIYSLFYGTFLLYDTQQIVGKRQKH